MGKYLRLLSGPMLFVVVMVWPMEAIPFAAKAVMAVTSWVAVWWVTEAIPIPVTSLLPMVLFPMVAGLDLSRISGAYAHPTVFLFMGGFVIALAIERWDLHKRIALVTIHMMGTKAALVLFGFMVSTWFLSMWISNTAATLMMLPIAIAVANRLQSGSEKGIGLPLMLGIAYAASIGGISTLIGTPTNVIFSAVIKETLLIDISFAKWLMLALPISILMLMVTWALLYIMFKKNLVAAKIGSDIIGEELRKLGGISRDEWKVIAVFSVTALAWITRSFLLEKLIPGLNDTIIAIAGACVLFMIPASKGDEWIMDWKTAKNIPWGVLLLFGGGLSIATAFKDSGLDVWVGEQFAAHNSVSVFGLFFVINASVNFLTELTSNVATAGILLPLLNSLAKTLDIHPLLLMAGATLSASCAFMLPVATPPNAVVFGSGMVTIRQMIKAGVLLNIISIFVISIFLWLSMGAIWSIDVFKYPVEIIP
ncbi:MAG: SLC13 family permease [Cyclobacteriaceae bacterium]